MMTFRNPSIVPPGGVYFWGSDSLLGSGIISAMSMPEVRNKVAAFLSANKLPVPADLEKQIEDYMCRRLPDGFCHGTSPDEHGVKVMTNYSVKDATKMALRRSKGMLPASSTDPERRAETCAKCPLNRAGLCPTCTGLRPWASSLTGGRRTLKDPQIGICSAEGTLLWAHVHFDVGVKPGVTYHPDCWMTKESLRHG